MPRMNWGHYLLVCAAIIALLNVLLVALLLIRTHSDE
jgi:hypothetical protein